MTKLVRNKNQKLFCKCKLKKHFSNKNICILDLQPELFKEINCDSISIDKNKNASSKQIYDKNNKNIYTGSSWVDSIIHFHHFPCQKRNIKFSD
ncbi:hypothetical protein EHP00_240 [Ecytonucleospora hepatopenaei]|uniref:Uncharacterized protein n=1 Tax=Ecytonucleospora hepatopenaei TaxID=646526 RepID=A0A1W0E6Q2_9MICR|nr:hypothetical protein EHP00_240 [Ecytonucleospora hepatopenaei]